MAKDININSQEWCELVFEGKNKSYGAYYMRKTSGKRHTYAFVISILFLVFVAYLPTLIESVKSRTQRESMTEVTELSDLKLEEQVKEENILRQEEAPPPPPLKSTIKFTPPVIADASEVSEADEMKSQEDLQGTKLSISVADVKGTDDEHGVDIADLKEHKVIIEEKPAITAEQMPEFPGGELELMKFIKSNLRYPSAASELGIEGRVTIRFVVSKTGAVSSVEVIRGFDRSCDNEAVRVVKMMPNWIPGRQNGRNVPVYYTLPILFRLGSM
ncbi:MAG: TonB family protein [Bacteroidales bacterium]|nr:TonB family protein [Bacteroidales bacterium]